MAIFNSGRAVVSILKRRRRRDERARQLRIRQIIARAQLNAIRELRRLERLLPVKTGMLKRSYRVGRYRRISGSWELHFNWGARDIQLVGRGVTLILDVKYAIWVDRRYRLLDTFKARARAISNKHARRASREINGA